MSPRLTWAEAVPGLAVESAPGLEVDTAPGVEVETAPGEEVETAPGAEVETAPGAGRSGQAARQPDSGRSQKLQIKQKKEKKKKTHYDKRSFFAMAPLLNEQHILKITARL